MTLDPTQEFVPFAPEAQLFTQPISRRPVEFIDDSEDYTDYDTEIRQIIPSLNTNDTSVKVINKRTGTQPTPIERSSFTELDLMPIRCFGCGKVIRQVAIEDSLARNKSIYETMNELNYRRICCRGQIKSHPSIERQLKQLKESSRLAQALEAGELFLEATSERPRAEPSQGLIILDEVPPDFPAEMMGSKIYQEGAGVFEENPAEEMDTFAYFQSQVSDPNA